MKKSLKTVLIGTSIAGAFLLGRSNHPKYEVLVNIYQTEQGEKVVDSYILTTRYSNSAITKRMELPTDLGLIRFEERVKNNREK